MLLPRELRRRAFGAFRELFTRIGRRPSHDRGGRRSSLGGRGQLSLLDALLRPQTAPPILFIATARSADGSSSDAHDPRALAEAIPGLVRVLHLGPLAACDARALALRSILNGGPASDLLAQEIASEASGHPLFIDELALHAAAGHDTTKLLLDDALGARIAQLDPAAQRVTELVALALAPLTQDAVAAAAAMTPGELAPIVSLLRASNVVRTSGVRVTDRIEPYHDRVRQAVLRRIDPDTRRARHEALATVIAARQPRGAEGLAVHWREAGHPAIAAKYAAIRCA